VEAENEKRYVECVLFGVVDFLELKEKTKQGEKIKERTSWTVGLYGGKGGGVKTYAEQNADRMRLMVRVYIE
jgi:hypothetical protein